MWRSNTEATELSTSLQKSHGIFYSRWESTTIYYEVKEIIWVGLLVFLQLVRSYEGITRI